MANAKIGSHTFNINPSSASWSYMMKVNSIDTYGGRVNQILNCNISGMKISGYITQKDTADYQWKQMEEFERKIKEIMDWQVGHKSPVDFSFPALSWTGKVYVTGYSDVSYSPETSAVSYTINMEVDSGFSSIQEAVSSQGLENIQSGVNYVRSEYNYPNMDQWDSVKEALGLIVEKGGEYGDEQYYSLYQAMKHLEEEQESKKEDPIEKLIFTACSSLSESLSKAGGVYSFGDDYSEEI